MKTSDALTAEHARLQAARDQGIPWKKWGPYLSERQWGTVREDYSEGGDAWNYFTHDQARSRAYRWGEDGLAGISDDHQRLCLSLALWNGRDPILKERLFGLTNSESNHGEDVKEYYYYLDSTPTHSYMKYLYKYPQAGYPYADLVETSRRRGRHEFEYELIDTGVFDQDRYFDVFVEYAKEAPEEILIQISVYNRGPESALLHVLPTLWFRNRWSWGGSAEKPVIQLSADVPAGRVVKVVDSKLGERYLYCEGKVPVLFTENETNTQRIFGVSNRSPYVKDGISNFVVLGQEGAVNPKNIGTKAAAHYHLALNPGESKTVRLCLSSMPPAVLAQPGSEGASSFGRRFADVLQARRKEADEFYAAITTSSLSADAANVMRQALAGMLRSFTYRLEEAQRGEGDMEWLKACFQKLLLNLTWWVNRKDRSGCNVFEGGFLGLDNIGVFDRSAPLPTGGYLEQADGTAWMALFCQNMFEIAAEIAMTDASYEDMALKLFEHYMWIASSLAHLGRDTGMWDEEDGFFYDVLRLPNGASQRLKVRSMVGLLPLCAVTVLEGPLIAKYPEFEERILRFVEARTELIASIHDPRKVGAVPGHRLAAILDETKLRRVLAKMLDENEFLSPYGLRSVSRYHAEHPYVIRAGGQEYHVSYLPAESDTGMFGGNSNWRGPIWMPVNALVIRALLHYYGYYGKDFTVECPTGSGRQMNLYQVALELGHRLTNIFLRDKEGRRPVNGGTCKFQEDPHWRDYVLFYEYFHGDNGAGLGASHQTGWTGIIARIIELFAVFKPEYMEVGKKAYFKAEVESEMTSALADR